MTRRPIYFELSSSVVLITSGFWLFQNEVANSGLMLVGCLLAVLSIGSLVSRRRQPCVQGAMKDAV